MAAVFPSLAACQDNAPAGPIEIPDHPLVRETLGDCLNEAMDIEGLKALVRRFEQDTVRMHFVDTVEPSVLAHEILNGAPFTYLDEDTEIGERRSRTVPLRRGLPVEPRELGRLDPDAIERVRAEASARRARPRRAPRRAAVARRQPPAAGMDRAVRGSGRRRTMLRGSRSRQRPSHCGVRPSGVASWRPCSPALASRPDHPLPLGVGRRARRCGRRRRRGDSRPGSSRGLRSGHARGTREHDRAVAGARSASRSRRSEGAGSRSPVGSSQSGVEQWCARRLLGRIHSYTRERRRAAVRPITQDEWRAFLERWWHAASGTQRHGRAGLAEVIEQLQGFEWPAGEWERIFAERVESYRPEWLDDLCLSGEVTWGRLSLLEPAVEGDDPGDEKPRWRGEDALPAHADHVHAAAGSALAAAGPPRRSGAGRADRRVGSGGARCLA